MIQGRASTLGPHEELESCPPVPLVVENQANYFSLMMA